jgi:hypothetical protein
MRSLGFVFVAVTLLSFGVSGCAHRSANASGTAAAPAKPKVAKGVPAPAGSKLAKVQKEMTPEQVRTIMGAPNHEKSYPTAKAFIPYYYGADAGVNTEWAYKGVGRVVFGVNKYTNVTRVIRIDYDPSEDGL